MIGSLLRIIEYIVGFFYNRSKDTSLTDNQKAKKMQESKEKFQKAIEEAEKTKDLDEIRKMAAK